MASQRQNFPKSVAEGIAKAAMYFCSNPDCLRLTGYATTEGRPRAIAEAGHINAASQGGPRSSTARNAKNLKTSSNGIWLCAICHKKIDGDPRLFPASLLRKWKRTQEDVIRSVVGKDLEAALLDLRSHKRFYEECREFLAFLESRRVLYEGLDHEFPPRVLESLQLIRERIVITLAKLPPDSNAASALNHMQDAIRLFLKDIGPATDLRDLRCDSNDPTWRKFSDELLKLRTGIVILMKVVAGDADYRLIRV